MPKLSKDTLEKRFTCQYCGESKRTRQGLSGHIQFKHPSGQKPPYADFKYLFSKAKHLKSVRKSAGLSDSQSKHEALIVARFYEITQILDILHITVSNQDFKNYLISCLAYMHENEELEERLISRFKTLLEEYK